jgi:peroxiredoxin
MPALGTGKIAPDFALNTTDGKQVVLHELLDRGPVVLAFFKVSCPVCQFAFPYYERLARVHREEKGVTVLGICQNKVSDAKAFAREYGVTFPIALDNDANGYEVSNAYGLTNVPTLFYIAPSGEIEVSSVGWSKGEVEEINAHLSVRRELAAPAIWKAGEDIPAFRAG